MSPERKVMSHEDAFTALDAVALDALGAADRDAIFAHIDGCEICRLELTQLRDTAAFLAFSSPPGSDTPTKSRGRIHSRLMARAAAFADDYPRTTVERPPARTTIRPFAWRRAEWMAAAAGILLLASVAMLAKSMRDRERLRDALTTEIARADRVRLATDSLRVAVMSRDSLIAGLTGKDVAMMTLTSTGVKAPFAHMFWDRATNMWTLVAHNMPELKPGRTYQLWLVTPTAKISAGTFDTRNGEGMIRAMYPLAPSQLAALAVTEEPAGGMPQPTGSMVMAVQAH
jgi:hypothetical protein